MPHSIGFALLNFESDVFEGAHCLRLALGKVYDLLLDVASLLLPGVVSLPLLAFPPVPLVQAY